MIRPDDVDVVFTWVMEKIAEGKTFTDLGLRVDVHPDVFATVADAFGDEPFRGPTGHMRIRNREMSYDGNPPGALHSVGLSRRQRELIKGELASTAECAFLMGVRAAAAHTAASTQDA